MANKVRELTVPAISYLNDVRGGDVSENQDVQRRFCSDNSFINGIAATVLTGDYLPPIILGEISLGNGMTQQYIVDAMQRTSALMKIRFGNYKITSAIEDSVIEYQSKKYDESGAVCRDENGSIVWEQKEFDIKNKTFYDFPDELKKRYDNYQLRIAIHQNCTMEKISMLVRRYNNHRAMNTSQKAFTYLDLYARRARAVSEAGFFKNCMNFSETENRKGTYEKLVCESVMAVFHLNSWKKTPKQMNIFLNDNAGNGEFDKIQDYADRMEAVCDDRFTDVFVPKNIAVWFAVFDKFTRLGLEDEKFGAFVHELREQLHSRRIDGLSYDSLNREAGTKDKRVIINKINVLCSLMLAYLQVELPEEEDRGGEALSVINFLKENVSQEIEPEDVELYQMSLEDYAAEIEEEAKKLVDRNVLSFTALVAYAFQRDIDGALPGWLADYTSRAAVCKQNQKENYLLMRADLERYLVHNQ